MGIKKNGPGPFSLTLIKHAAHSTHPFSHLKHTAPITNETRCAACSQFSLLRFLSSSVLEFFKSSDSATTCPLQVIIFDFFAAYYLFLSISSIVVSNF